MKRVITYGTFDLLHYGVMLIFSGEQKNMAII